MKRRIFVALMALTFLTWIAMNGSDAQQNNEISDAAKIQQLLQQRHDALKQRYDAVMRRHEDGSLHSKHVIPALDDLFRAKQEITSSKEDKIEICRQRIENLRRGEGIAEGLRKVGVGSIEDHALATAARIQAEIDCLRLKSTPE